MKSNNSRQTYSMVYATSPPPLASQNKITLLKSLSLKYTGRNLKNLNGELWRENKKKVALEISKPTQGKEEEERRKEANLGRKKKIINSQGI